MTKKRPCGLAVLVVSDLKERLHPGGTGTGKATGAQMHTGSQVQRGEDLVPPPPLPTGRLNLVLHCSCSLQVGPTGTKARGGIQLPAKETTMISNVQNGEILPKGT